MAELVSAAEYARRRGVSRMAVSKAIASGRISVIEVDGKRLIDVDQANVEWAARTDPDQQHRGAPAEFAKTQRLGRASAAAKRGPPVRAAGAARAASATSAASRLSRSLIEEKTRTERLRIEREELDLAERRGELVSLEGIRQAIAPRLIAAREAFEAIPDRLSARIAATSDAHAVHQMLREEIRRVLTLLATVSPAGPH